MSTKASPNRSVAKTYPQLLKILLPVLARVTAGAVRDAGELAGVATLLGVGDSEGAIGVPVTALDAEPSPWLFTANNFTW